MMTMKLFNDYHAINNDDMNLLRSVATALNLKVTKADISLFDVHEIIANMSESDSFTSRCNNISVWHNVDSQKHYTVRIECAYADKLSSESNSADLLLNTLYSYKVMKERKKDNERKYQFNTMKELVHFLFMLNQYTAQKEATKEATEQKEVIAV